jgi:MraZ protein
VELFEGPSALTLDGKGRVSVPARYRDALLQTSGGKLTVTKHPHGCLLVFPQPAWGAFRDQVAKLPYSQVGIKRIFLGHADEVEMDSTARILIHPELREWAHLVRDVKLLGMGSHFELWDAQVYAASEAQAVQQDAAAALDTLTF